MPLFIVNKFVTYFVKQYNVLIFAHNKKQEYENKRNNFSQ